jgi:hypothetical protein
MTTTRKKLLIGFAVAVVGAGLGSEGYRFLDRRAVASEALEAKNAATASVNSSATVDDARQWLEANGYRVIVWNPHDPRGFVGQQESSTDGTHVIVQGQRQIRTGHWPSHPTWLDLTFRFKVEGAFFDVQAEPSPMEVPTTRRAG